jgi:hypothetical protein
VLVRCLDEEVRTYVYKRIKELHWAPDLPPSSWSLLRCITAAAIGRRRQRPEARVPRSDESQHDGV